MSMKILEDGKRAAIVDVLSRDELKFNELAKKLSMRSNELSYHLNLLLLEDCIRKDGTEKYVLSDKGKTLVPYLKFIQKEEIPPTIFCAPVVVHKNKVLFIRRHKEPYKGFLEFPGGKPRKGETLIQAAIRELREETNMLAENGRIIAIADLLTSKNHHFLGVYVRMDFVKDLGVEGAEHDEIVWLKKSEIKAEKMLLDDNKLIVSKFLDSDTQYLTIFYDEERNNAKLV